jgi:hypothetical protein
METRAASDASPPFHPKLFSVSYLAARRGNFNPTQTRVRTLLKKSLSLLNHSIDAKPVACRRANLQNFARRQKREKLAYVCARIFDLAI